MQVLTEPKNALVKQYQRLFEMEEAELEFTHDASRDRPQGEGEGHRRPRPALDHRETSCSTSCTNFRRARTPREYMITDKNVRGEEPVVARPLKAAKKDSDSKKETA